MYDLLRRLPSCLSADDLDHFLRLVEKPGDLRCLDLYLMFLFHPTVERRLRDVFMMHFRQDLDLKV